MSTKSNPGEFDCYAAAEPDEPLFILLGRDRHAPTLVWLWAVLREIDQEEPQKVANARDCCLAMLKWQHEKGRSAVGLGQGVLAGILELMRAANHAGRVATNDATDVEVVRRFLSQAFVKAGA